MFARHPTRHAFRRSHPRDVHDSRSLLWQPSAYLQSPYPPVERRVQLDIASTEFAARSAQFASSHCMKVEPPKDIERARVTQVEPTDALTQLHDEPDARALIVLDQHRLAEHVAGSIEHEPAELFERQIFVACYATSGRLT